MRLPAPLLRHNPKNHKNDFGHVLVLAGSPRMLGAAALTCHAAMRAGAGLVTLGIAQSLNLTAQRKIPSVTMTLPLKETTQQCLSLAAYPLIKKESKRFDVLALGPGLSQDPSTKKLILKIIAHLEKPMVIDADALNAIAGNLSVLKKTSSAKIITPHPGEMARLTGQSSFSVEKNRKASTLEFARRYRCTAILKGHKTIVASKDGEVYINATGNVGMASAGTGDVLTGMIAAFLAQGITPFEAAKLAAFFHGKAGDIAAKRKGKVSLLATDIIDDISTVLKTNA